MKYFVTITCYDNSERSKAVAIRNALIRYHHALLLSEGAMNDFIQMVKDKIEFFNQVFPRGFQLDMSVDDFIQLKKKNINIHLSDKKNSRFIKTVLVIDLIPVSEEHSEVVG